MARYFGETFWHIYLAGYFGAFIWRVSQSMKQINSKARKRKGMYNQ
jgi:hypothetical protein